MWIKNINLIKFRNYFYESINFDKDINIFIGDNAQGKTNLIESIYFLANAKSFKKIKDVDLITFGENEMRLKGLIQKKNRFKDVEIKLVNNKKEICVNKIKYTKNRDLQNIFNIVTFTPEDLKIAKEGPSLRRDLFDDIIIQINPIYKKLKSSYLRILDNRNKLLKKRRDKYFNEELLANDEQISKVGFEIEKYRKKYVKIVEKYASNIQKELTNNNEILEIKYIPDLNVDSFEEYKKMLFSNRKVDFEKLTTSSGVHRDDIKIYINGKDIRNFASQGQQRSVVLVIKLASVKMLFELKNEKAIVLLDDVFSELDEKRSKFLLKNLKGFQTIITSTDFTNIEKMKNTKVRRIVKGHLV
ncbi:MAG: DNA replication/repair protein RecF [Peptoniphilaceae bacterium]|nr:DNA replication/repair protein RecF [Peptoniphilaceae bacterium]MDY3738528.1 DNA replication/repair protein RecF [Peptoniphilaceae bacterium]